MNNQKKNLLTEKQKLENSKILLQLQKEINELERKVKNYKINHIKIKTLRGLKYLLETGRLIAPYIIAAGITFGSFSAFGKTPFYRDNQKYYLEKMEEFDSFGNIRYEQQYDNYNNAVSVVNYYSKWRLSDNGFYSRDIERYSIGNINEDFVINLISENKILSLRDILGQPISKKTEFKNNLTTDEINQDEFLQYVFYSKNKDDFIIKKESISENIATSFLCFILVIFLEGLIIDYRRNYSPYDYQDALLKIKEKYPFIDVDVLKKKLEIKKNNYERLIR